MEPIFGRAAAIVILGALFLGAARHASGAEPRPADATPAVRELLAGSVAAYRRLDGYEDHGELRVEFGWVPKRPNGKPHVVTAPCRLAFQRPNKFAVMFGNLRLYSNGRDLVTVIDSLKRDYVAPAPEAISLRTFNSGLTGELLLHSADSIPLTFLLSAVFGRDPAMGRAACGGTVVQEADRQVDGKPCRCVRLSAPEKDQEGLFAGAIRPLERVLPDSETKLFSAIEIETALPRALFSAIPCSLPPEPPPGLEGVIIEALPLPALSQTQLPYRWTWRAGVIATAAPDPRTFEFDPPADYTKARSEDEFLAVPPPEPPLPGPALPGRKPARPPIDLGGAGPVRRGRLR